MLNGERKGLDTLTCYSREESCSSRASNGSFRNPTKEGFRASSMSASLAAISEHNKKVKDNGPVFHIQWVVEVDFLHLLLMVRCKVNTGPIWSVTVVLKHLL